MSRIELVTRYSEFLYTTDSSTQAWHVKGRKHFWKAGNPGYQATDLSTGTHHVKGRKRSGKGDNAGYHAFSFEVVRSQDCVAKTCHAIKPFPNKPWFLHVCSTCLLKTLREKEKEQYLLFPQCFLPI